MAKLSGIADLLKDIGKRTGVKFQELEQVTGDTTGNIAIDHITGVFGLPRGRITELYGPPSSGKTTTALQCAAALQQKIIAEGLDKHILYLDFEQALDPDYCAALGLDIWHESFILAQPIYMEQGGEVSLELLATGKLAMIIVDSVAAMAPKALSEGDFDQRTAALNRARLLNGWCLRLIGQLREHQTTCVFINHLSEEVDMGFKPSYGGPKQTTPGGRGLKFYASLRILFMQIGQIKGSFGDALIAGLSPAQVGTLTRVKVTKNKVGPPFRQADVRVSYGEGFDNAWSALQILINHKAIGKIGAWYTIKSPSLQDPTLPTKDGKTQFHGADALLDFAAAHHEWRDRLIGRAAAVLAEYGDGAGTTRAEYAEDSDGEGAAA